jgi:hypothetical protein
MRYTSALSEKRRKFSAYMQQGVVRPDDLRIIAISGGGLRSYGEGLEPPYIVRAVFPIGNMYAALSRESGEIVETGHHFQPSVRRRSGAEISTASFLEPEYAIVSGIVFDAKRLTSFPQPSPSSFIAVRNPLALSPLPPGTIQRGREYWAVEDGEGYRLECHNWELRTSEP